LAKLTGKKAGYRGPKRNWRRVMKADEAKLKMVCNEVARAKDETDIQFPDGTPEAQFYTLAGAFMDALMQTGSVSKAYLQLYQRAPVRRKNHPRTHGNELLELIKTYFPNVGSYMREWCYRIGVTPPFLVNQLRELAVNGADNVRLQATKSLLNRRKTRFRPKAIRRSRTPRRNRWRSRCRQKTNNPHLRLRRTWHDRRRTERDHDEAGKSEAFT